MQKVAADAGRCRTIGCTMGNQKQKGQSDISDSDWTIAPPSLSPPEKSSFSSFVRFILLVIIYARFQPPFE